MSQTLKNVARLLNRDPIEVEKHWRKGKRYAASKGSKGDYLQALQYTVSALKLDAVIPMEGDVVELEDKKPYEVQGSCPCWCRLIDPEGNEFRIPLWALVA